MASVIRCSIEEDYERMGNEEESRSGAPNLNVMEETPEEKSKRMRSIRIVHCAMFVFSLGFSIVITGVYPYMQQLLQPDCEEEGKLVTQYGYVVAANPLGQMIFSPVFGWAVNKLGSIRWVSMGTAVLYVVGNVLYSTLSLFPQNSRFALMLVARFMVGSSSANSAPFRAYVSSATYENERTRHMSYCAAAQSIGFIVGPTIQALLTPIGCSDKVDQDSYLSFDMYTGAGWVSALFGLGCLLLFLPGVFTDFNVTEKEKALKVQRGEIDEDQIDEKNLPKPDIFVLCVLLFCFWEYFVNFVMLETLGTPMCLDEFGWTDSEAVLYLGIAMTVGGVIAMGCFLSVGPLAKRYDERLLIIFLGIVPMILFRVFMFPFGDGEIIMANGTQDCSTEKLFADQANSRSLHYPFDPRSQISKRNGECGENGEPPYCKYDWCEDQPQINMTQHFIGFLGFFFAYPYCIAICQSIYSKVIGPRPQGVWMGYLTASGSLARVMGPIYVTYVYNAFGLYVTFGIIEILTVMALVFTLLFYNRMVPLQTNNLQTISEMNKNAVAGSSTNNAYVSEIKMTPKELDSD